MKNALSKLLTTAAVAGLGLTLPSANAALLSFSGATLIDGGVITGSFDYTGGVVSSVNITTTAGSTVTFVQTYTSGLEIGPSVIVFTGTSTKSGTAVATLAIEITTPTVPAAGPATWAAFDTATINEATIKVGVLTPLIAPSYESLSEGNTQGQQRVVDGGIIIPEPSTYAMIAGLGMVAFAAYRRMGSKA